LSHSFNRGGNQLTETLSSSLNVSYNEAREIKEKQGIISGQVQANGKPVEIKKILMPLVDFILGEVKKVLRNFYQEEGKKVDKMILSGGFSLMPGLKDYFFNEIKTETRIADPFNKLEFNPQLKEVLKKEGPSYAVAVGLALKGLKK
jgi:type IV pilus assembly protein PilM